MEVLVLKKKSLLLNSQARPPCKVHTQRFTLPAADEVLCVMAVPLAPLSSIGNGFFRDLKTTFYSKIILDVKKGTKIVVP